MRVTPPYALWKWCAVTSLAMVLLSLIPQIHLWIVRGRDWNGAYVSPQGDEPLYSAYVNALMDRRTRKNDPFGGRDSTLASPLPESTFSIQFIPAYVISFFARTFHASASTAFIVVTGAAALLASLFVFWLLNSIAGDHQLAAAGTLFVLCLGGFVGSYGVFGTFVDIAVPALPFLRRYQPAAVFPLFFIFQLLVWRAFTMGGKRGSQFSAIMAGVTLAILVFSYLYLWTAAAAWLACIGVLWLYLRPSERRKTLRLIITISVMTAIALVPYVYLVSQRAATLDEQQTLVSSHRPDFLRVHEILGAVILVSLGAGVLRRKFESAEPRVIYAASLALLPFVVFNQQILTGKMMQVFHFEIFDVNYSTTTALLITATLFWKPVPRRVLTWMAALSIAWGFIVVALPARVAFVSSAVANDQRIPVLLRLRELSKQDGTIEDLRIKGQTSTLVFSPILAMTVQLPTWTSYGTLLDVGGLDFGSVTREERKHFFYMHLYYSGAEAKSLRDALNGLPDDPIMGLYARSVIFGHERITPALSYQFKSIRPDEIEREVQAYQAFRNSFSREDVLKRPIAYAVIPIDGKFDFTNLDRWYERDGGERVGAYVLYRMKMRAELNK